MARVLTLIPRTYDALPSGRDSEQDASSAAGRASVLASTDELSTLLNLAGTKVNPALGNVLGAVLDCQGNAAAGVELRIDQTSSGQTLPYCQEANNAFSTTATETTLAGGAGFFNIPTGLITITATVIASNRRLGRYTFLSKAGNVSYLPMPPGPS